MTKYRAIVSITFDDEDLSEFAEMLGVSPDRLDPRDTIHGALDNLDFGCGWLEQLYEDKRPTIAHLSRGVSVEISDHE